MADEHEPEADVPQTDVPETDIPDTDLAWIADALAGLTELDPAAEPPADAEPMPAWVWVRLQGALAAERASAGAGVDAEVIDLAARRPGRATRWAGGLVAASVAVLAVGVGVTAFRGNGSDGSLVATEGGGVAMASAMSAPLAEAAGSPAPAADAKALTAPELAAPQLTFAGMVPPTLRLVGSDTDYTSSGLRTQVRTVMDRIGLPMSEATAELQEQAPETVVMPEVEPIGFLSSAQRLRDCITKLTQEAESTALMVDMSTYQGQDAGVVVAPDYPAAASEPDMSELEVWIVDPECDKPQKMLTLAVEQ